MPASLLRHWSIYNSAPLLTIGAPPIKQRMVRDVEHDISDAMQNAHLSMERSTRKSSNEYAFLGGHGFFTLQCLFR